MRAPRPKYPRASPHNRSPRHAPRHRRDRTPPPRPHSDAGDCEPYYFDWLKCIDKCAMPHIMQKLK